MSDDLISRKDLLGTERLLMTDIVKYNPTARFILEQVLYDIDNQPMAYDPQKVINAIDNTVPGITNMQLMMISDIVKSGGVAK